MKISKAFTSILFSALMLGVCNAGIKKEIKFSKGSSLATIEESVIRGERDLYYLTAKAGQIITVDISALEDNAVFTIFKPGAIVTVEDGFTEINGEAMPKATETDDAKIWKGHFPISGEYLIVVGGTRGSATYKLKISIH
ncbi:MAG: hypothetical protein V1872_00310 [bacterium]